MVDEISDATGFVCLIDVLGFRELVARNAYHGYLATVAELLGTPPSGQALQYVLFSDTVVVIAESEDIDALWNLGRACSILFAGLLKNHIAVRGAIAFGKYRQSATEHGVIVAGQPIVDAFEYEQKQDWIGIMLCPSLLQKYPEIEQRCRRKGGGSWAQDHKAFEGDLRWQMLFRRHHAIPFHGDEKFDGLALVPCTRVVTIADAIRSWKDSGSALRRMKLAAPSPASQRKYASTIAFTEALIQGKGDEGL